MLIYRAWINAPSALQQDHKMHGLACIAEDGGDKYIRVWFAQGTIISTLVDRIYVCRVQ